MAQADFPSTPRRWSCHGARTRPEEALPRGVTLPNGRFGRMFGHLEWRSTPDAALVELGAAMVERIPDARGDNPDLPAGFTYFGQFVDHDLTFDPTPLPEQHIDPLCLFNFRTPRLDLDSLYGLGPAGQPYLYARDNRAKLLLGVSPASQDAAGQTIPELASDLPRNAEGFALIGDPRNDENLIVAQLHLAFLKFHNAVVDHLEPDPARQSAVFEQARKLVTWHYQWIVLHDFLGRLLVPEALQAALVQRRYFTFEREPYIPVEFSVAAYRFGHSMVRGSYNYNRVFGSDLGALGAATLERLFFFTGPARTRPGQSLRSVPVPSHWAIDWRRFFPLRDSARLRFNHSRRLDPLLTSELHDLRAYLKVDAPPSSLAIRNLLRGERVQLPSGQAVAGAMRLPVLSPERLAAGPDGAVASRQGLLEDTPLWYYLLKEAEVVGGGRRLGPLASALLAEVFVGLLEGDPGSYLCQRPNWTPTLPRQQAHDFTMADLLLFADRVSPVINPIDDPRSRAQAR